MEKKMNKIEQHENEIFEACRAAMLAAIEAGIEDVRAGQALQATNEVLFYPETGKVDVVRHVGGCTLGDVYIGKAISIAKYIDWRADGFETEDADDIDQFEILSDYENEIWNTIERAESLDKAGEEFYTKQWQLEETISSVQEI